MNIENTEQIACMGFDAFRILQGMEPKTYTAKQICAYLVACSPASCALPGSEALPLCVGSCAKRGACVERATTPSPTDAASIDSQAFWDRVIAYCGGVGYEGKSLVEFINNWGDQRYSDGQADRAAAPSDQSPYEAITLANLRAGKLSAARVYVGYCEVSEALKAANGAIKRYEAQARAAAPVSGTPNDMQQFRYALEVAMQICDAVPTRLHHSPDSALAHIGMLVNARPDGKQGYAIIRDALYAARAATPEMLFQASESAAPVSGQGMTDADINEITERVLCKWPSFEAQSWACKVVHAVLDSRPRSEDSRAKVLNEAAHLCECIGTDWLDADDANKNYAADYLAKAIRALATSAAPAPAAHSSAPSEAEKRAAERAAYVELNRKIREAGFSGEESDAAPTGESLPVQGVPEVATVDVFFAQDGVEGRHHEYGRGTFFTDNCMKTVVLSAPTGASK